MPAYKLLWKVQKYLYSSSIYLCYAELLCCWGPFAANDLGPYVSKLCRPKHTYITLLWNCPLLTFVVSFGSERGSHFFKRLLCTWLIAQSDPLLIEKVAYFVWGCLRPFYLLLLLLSLLSGIVITMILLLLIYSYTVDLLFTVLLLFGIKLTLTPWPLRFHEKHPWDRPSSCV